MKTLRYHFTALMVVIVWGTTFVATKMLLYNGLSPKDIFFYRFLLAYVCIWIFGGSRFFRHKEFFAGTFKDEFLLMLMGITGGSLYFVAANTALDMTTASNVALLVCVAPIFTVLLSLPFLKNERLGRYWWQGSLLALAGVAFVVFNGRFVLEINPLGDKLSLLAAFSWALYTILLKRLGSRYSTQFITRKVFFYGLLTLLPLFLFQP
ncbi:MAG: DMT family transporter, partial [Spirochaetes bacterium]|nr:DMT family transporter [Spirochaetota bacterium]